MPAGVRAVLVVALLGGCSGPQRHAGDHLAELRAAGLPRRVLPRLSVLADHRPCEAAPAADIATVPGALCAGGADDRAARKRALRIQASARRAARERVDPGAMHAVALIDLLWTLGDRGRVDGVVHELETVARLAPSADVLGDLAAAYIVRAGIADRAGDLVAAVDAAQRALEREPGPGAARFNAALAEQRLALDRVAAEDWDAYLAGAPPRPWADEARRSRATLVFPAADSFPVLRAGPAVLARMAAGAPQRARETAVEQLMPQWAAAVLAGDTATAEDRLRRVEVIGAALLRRPGGDASAADIAAAARASAGHSLARAIVTLGTAQRALGKRELDDAETAFARAERLGADVPLLRAWCAVGRGVGRFYRDEGDRGASIFLALAARPDSGRYPALAGRARWSLGTILGRRGNFADAVEHASRAEWFYRRAGEAGNAAFAHYLASEGAWHLGDAEGSARRMYRVLHELRRARHSTPRHNQLYVAAQAAGGDGLRHAAARLLDDDVAGLEGASPSSRAEPLLRRAEARAALGWRALARSDLHAGAVLLDSLPDPQQREWIRQDRRLAQAALDERPTAVTLARVDSVVAFFDNPSRVARLVPALLARADVRLALGDAAGTRADLDSVSRMLSKRSGLLRSVAFRASMLEARRSVFERLALLLIREGRPAEALVALDRGRVPLFARRAGEGMLRSAPAGTVVASLSVVADTLLVWTLRGNRVRLSVDTVAGDTLARLVDALATGLEAGVERPGIDAVLSRLHGLLVSGMGELPPGAELVVVADGILSRVPFTALRDPASGRYLLQDHAVRYGTTLADATAPRPRPIPPGGRALVVAPSFDHVRHPSLEPLPAAEREARIVAAVSPRAVLLAGREATLPRVRAALAGAGLVHVASHAVFDDARPSRSYLVLARGPEGDVLQADELESLDLRGVRLVVFSACRTQRTAGRGSGMAGLTAAAMKAGAGGVIGSLWRVEDSQTLELMTALHREYQASGDPSAALRRAQLTLLRSADSRLRSPAAWAGFRYVGL